MTMRPQKAHCQQRDILCGGGEGGEGGGLLGVLLAAALGGVWLWWLVLIEVVVSFWVFDGMEWNGGSWVERGVVEWVFLGGGGGEGGGDWIWS